MDVTQVLDEILAELETLITQGSLDDETGGKLAALIDGVKADPSKGNIEVLAETLKALSNVKIQENIDLLKSQMV